jgi:hypothetical protein
MALPYDTIDAITDEGYLPNIRQVWADQDLVASRLHKAGTNLQGGDRIKQSVFYNFSKGNWYDEYGQFDISSEERISAAYWEWKLLNVPMVMSRLDQLRNRGPMAVHNLMEQITKGAGIRIGQLIAQAIFSSNNDSNQAINGLDNVIDDASGTLSESSSTVYGGIDRSDYSWWAGNTVDIDALGVTLGTDLSGSVKPKYALMNRFLSAAHDGNIRPNLVAMGVTAFYDYMEDVGSNMQRLVNTESAKAGFMSASINGVEVVGDRYITESTTDANNRMYAINTEYMDLVSHVDENIRREPWAKPIDQNVIVSHLFWAGGLTSSDPSRHIVGHDYDTN